MAAALARDQAEIVGRYALYGEIASGGMAVVHYGKLLGAVGFQRPVAIKRLHPQLARDPGVRAMFIDEARLASRIRHPNVVPTLDVVADGRDLLLVMEYVHGESLQHLMKAMRKRGQRIPLRVTLAIVSALLHGLHAAHEATTEEGEPLHVVHRDVSPQNVMVGVDGVARVLDFGIARAAVRLEHTREGIVKGKLAYMAPEQLGGAAVDRRADVYAAAVVLWEMVVGRRLFVKDDGGTVMVDKLLAGHIDPPSRFAPGTPKLLDAIVLHGLARSPEQRFATAREMALALERLGDLARPSEIGEWVEGLAAEALAARAVRLQEVERSSSQFRVATARQIDRELPTLFDEDEDDGADVVFDLQRPPDESSVVSASGSRRIPPPTELPALPAARPLAVFVAYALLGAAIVAAAVLLRWAFG
jgi:serine/threonine-protein kinase